MFRKFISLAVILCMIITLAACNSSDATKDQADKIATTEQATVDEIAAEEETEKETEEETKKPTEKETEKKDKEDETQADEELDEEIEFEEVELNQRCKHSWKAATCTEPKTCSKCDGTEGRPLGHDWLDATCNNPKTCRKCKQTIGRALGHSWKNATCTEPKTCRNCNQTTGRALGHDYSDATCTDASECYVCGKRYGSALGHSWKAATCTNPEQCSRCYETYGYPKRHNVYSDGRCGSCNRYFNVVMDLAANNYNSETVYGGVKFSLDYLPVSSLNEFRVYKYNRNNCDIYYTNTSGSFEGKLHSLEPGDYVVEFSYTDGGYWNGNSFVYTGGTYTNYLTVE